MFSKRAKSQNRTNFSCSSFKDVQTLIKDEEDPAHHRKYSIFNRIRLSSSVLRRWSTPSLSRAPLLLPRSPNRVVLYLTTLRIIRKTFDDCRAVELILRSLCVSIDERDLSMDSRFLSELQSIFREPSESLSLPRVFIGGRYFGGADEILSLHESGELKRLIQGLPSARTGVCDSCGGHGFLLCEFCRGSHKVYVEDCGFKICSSCNANGLIRDLSV